MSDLEAFAQWVLDQASVCVNDGFTNPVTLSFETDWIVVPEQFHPIVRAYSESADDPLNGLGVERKLRP